MVFLHCLTYTVPKQRTSMRKIRVLLAIQPRMLSEAVRHTIERQPDMEVISELIDPIGLLLALRATAVEVLITTPGDSDREPGLGSSLLAASPQLKIIALSATGDAAFLYESGSPKQRIDDMGEESMLGAIRALMR
jgi:DNA-binding NarL/FixJ family response regulator